MRIKTINFGFGSLIGGVLLLFIGIIIYTLISFIKQEKTVVTECRPIICPTLTCEEPEIIYKPYPEYLPEYIEKIINTTTTVEVVDKTCEDNFITIKKDLRSLIYTACIEKHQFCNYLSTN